MFHQLQRQNCITMPSAFYRPLSIQLLESRLEWWIKRKVSKQRIGGPPFFTIFLSWMVFRRLGLQDYIRLYSTKCGNCDSRKRRKDVNRAYRLDKRLSGCPPEIFQHDAANVSLRSLWEHIHHQQECSENISLIVIIKRSGSLVTSRIIFNLDK